MRFPAKLESATPVAHLWGWGNVLSFVTNQGAKIRFHKKAAEILKPLPLLNMCQDKIIEKPFVFLHSKKIEEKLMTAKEKGAIKRLEVVKWIVNKDLPLSCV